jgi:hypothetical protein
MIGLRQPIELARSVESYCQDLWIKIFKAVG